MARLGAAVLVVGAVLLLPPALAIPASSSSLPQSLPAVDAGASSLGAASTATAAASVPTFAADAAQAAGGLVDPALCRDAVRFTLPGYAGTGGDVRADSAAFVLPWVATSTVTRQVPVYGTTTETVRGLLGLLPQTRQVTGIVGYDTVTDTLSQTFDLAVHADWTSEYIAWHPDAYTALLTLPVGLPTVAAGDGVMTKVCDPSVPLLSTVPTSDPAAQYWSAVPMIDGWYTHLLGVDVHLASAQEVQELPTQDDGMALCPSEIMPAVHAAAARLGLSPDPLTTSGGAAGGQGPMAPSAAGSLPVASASSALHAGLGALAGLGLVAGSVAVVRRRR